jgi:hypothetical protein
VIDVNSCLLTRKWSDIPSIQGDFAQGRESRRSFEESVDTWL